MLFSENLKKILHWIVEKTYIFSCINKLLRFSDDRKIYLILEFAPEGEMYTSLQKLGKFDEETSANYILQLSAALQHCHQRNVSVRICRLCQELKWVKYRCGLGGKVPDHNIL